MASTMWMKENLNYLFPAVKLVLCTILLYPMRLLFWGLVFLYSEVAFTEGEMWLSEDHFAKLLSAFLWISETVFWYGALHNPVWMLILCYFILWKAVFFKLGTNKVSQVPNNCVVLAVLAPLLCSFWWAFFVAWFLSECGNVEHWNNFYISVQCN